MSEENLDVRKVIASYLSIVFRAVGYWKWGLALFLIITFAGTIYAATRQKIYASSTRIQVVQTQVTDAGDVTGGSDVGEQLRVRLKNFINANRFLQEIIDENHLYDDIKVRKNMTDREVLDYMRTKIETGVWGEDEYTFVFYDYNPVEAKAVTESLARSFISREKGADYSLYQTKLDHVDNQLDQLEKQLDSLTERQTRFKEINAEAISQIERRRLGATATDTSGTAGSTADTQPTQHDSPKLRRLRNQLKTLIDTEAGLSGKAGGVGVSSALATQKARIAEQVTKARAQYNRLKQQYTEEWPDVRSARANLSQLESQQRQIEAQYRDAQRKAAVPPAELQTVRRQIRETRDEVRRLAAAEVSELQKAGEDARPDEPTTQLRPGESALTSIEAVEAELKQMDTEIRPVRERVQELTIQKLKLQFRVKQAEQGGLQHVVVDPAVVPTKPAGPNRTKYALTAAGLGLFMGCALILLLGFIDSRVYRPSDLHRIEHIPMLAAVPDFENEMKEIVAVAQAQSGYNQDVGPPEYG